MKSDCRGFSLLEVLVAFVVLATVLGVIMRVFSGALGNIGVAEHYSRAVSIAESRLAAIGVEQALTEGNETGEAEGGYTWETSVSRFEGGGQILEGTGQNVALYQVEVTVRWDKTSGGNRSLRFVTLRAGSRT